MRRGFILWPSHPTPLIPAKAGNQLIKGELCWLLVQFARADQCRVGSEQRIPPQVVETVHCAPLNTPYGDVEYWAALVRSEF